MAKKCKHCWKDNKYPLNKFCSDYCFDAWGGKRLKQTTEIKRTPLKRPTEIKIARVSKKNKNTVASFSSKTKEIIFRRQKGKCLIYPDLDIEEYHHAYFWPIAANHWPNRNDPDQWVGLSHKAHHEIHHGITWEWKIFRAKCITYLIKYYKSLKKVL